MAKRPRAQQQNGSVDPTELEALLRERYRILWEDIQRELVKYRGEQYPDIVERASDPGDRAVEDLLVDLDIAGIGRDIDELRAVQRALARVKDGTYGRCASCGEPIDEARLRAVPEAVLCIDCKKRQERNTTATPGL